MTAGEDEGYFVVTAAGGAVRGSATFAIAKPGHVVPPPPSPPVGPGVLRWTGEKPPQKWMNFYTKVLPEFAGGKGLKLMLNFEVIPQGGVSRQKIEETKVALEELGLNSNRETR